MAQPMSLRLRPCCTPCASSRRTLAINRNACVRSAGNDGGKSESALSTLDSLLGEAGGSSAPQGPEPNLVEWWRIRPRQAAPPRTTSVSSSKSPAGRFIANEAMLRNEVWVGGKTQLGQALALPKVTPYMSYVVAVINAAVYGTIVRLYDVQGPEAAAELLGGIALSREAVMEQGELWRLLSGSFVQPDILTLAVVLCGMLAVAPRVEASLGYRTFAAALLLTTLVAADCLLALGGGTEPLMAASTTTASAIVSSAAAAAPAASAATAAGAAHAVLSDAALHPVSQALALTAQGSAAAVGPGPGVWLGGLGTTAGLAGCSVAHELTNGDVERRASGGETSSSSSGAGVRGLASLTAGAARAGLLAAGALAAALQHVGDPGGGGGGAVVAAVGAGFAAGFLLSSTAGPRYQVTREVELPAGSMWIPDPDAVEEVTVVLDQTTSLQRTLATTIWGFAAAVASAMVLYGSVGVQ